MSTTQCHSALNDSTMRLFEQRRKINIILDLDLTLIDSIYDVNTANSINQVYQAFDTAYQFIVLNHRFALLVRPYTLQLLQQLSVFANIYIITHGQTEYAEHVRKYIDPNKYIKRIVSRSTLSIEQKSIKSLYSNLLDIENTLIIDDQVGAWERIYQTKVMHCSKFDPFLKYSSKQHLVTDYEFYYSDYTGEGIVQIPITEFDPFENNIRNNGHLEILVKQIRSMYLEYILEDHLSIQAAYKCRLIKILGGCSFNFYHKTDKATIEVMGHIIRTLGGKVDNYSGTILGKLSGFVDVYYPAYCYLYLTKLDMSNYIIK